MDLDKLQDRISSIGNELTRILRDYDDLSDMEAIRKISALQALGFCRFVEEWAEATKDNIRFREAWEKANGCCDEDEEYEDVDEDEDDEDDEEDSLEITDIKLNGHPYEIIEFYSDDSGNEVKLPFSALSLEFSVNINGVRYYGRMHEAD